MIALGILMVLVGILFGGFGYLIAFRKKYALINHFVDDRHHGKFDEAYAKRVGLMELAAGFLFLLFGILSICIRSIAFSWIAVSVLICLTFIALALNHIFSVKRK